MFKRNLISKKFDRIIIQVNEDKIVTITRRGLFGKSTIYKGLLNSENWEDIKKQLINGKVVFFKIRHNSKNTAVKWKRHAPNGIKKMRNPNESIMNAVRSMKLTDQKQHSNILRNLDDDAGHSYCASTVLVEN